MNAQGSNAAVSPDDPTPAEASVVQPAGDPLPGFPDSQPPSDPVPTPSPPIPPVDSVETVDLRDNELNQLQSQSILFTPASNESQIAAARNLSSANACSDGNVSSAVSNVSSPGSSINNNFSDSNLSKESNVNESNVNESNLNKSSGYESNLSNSNETINSKNKSKNTHANDECMADGSLPGGDQEMSQASGRRKRSLEDLDSSGGDDPKVSAKSGSFKKSVSQKGTHSFPGQMVQAVSLARSKLHSKV